MSRVCKSEELDIRIVPAESAAQIAEAKALLREYGTSLGEHLCVGGFEEEIAELPGKYAPPRGRVLLACTEAGLAGCVALRPLEDAVCEMKRLYVRPALRSMGLGRCLAEAILDAAREMGYARMRLDTLPTFAAAVALYRSLDFRQISPYWRNPVPGVLFMERELGAVKSLPPAPHPTR